MVFSLSRLIGHLSKNIVYVQIHKNNFKLRNIRSAETIWKTSLKTFTTTRLLVGEFTEADNLLRAAMKELHKDSMFAPKPVVIMHPMEKTEGGLSQVEHRVLLELAEGAGALYSVIWIGHELSDKEAKARQEKI